MEQTVLLLEEVKTHLRIDIEDEDQYLKVLVAAAIDFCENFTGRAISNKRIEIILDAFPTDNIKILWYPIKSVNKVTYIDQKGVLKELDDSNYQSILDVEPPVIIPKTSWPQGTVNTPGAVRIEALAGYERVPKSIKEALLLLVGHFYENREVMRERYVRGSEIPFSVSALLYPYKVLRW